MPQHQAEFPISQVIRPISCKSPYSRWVDVQIGTVSILFSYGIPFGLDSIAGCFTLTPPSRATSKHLNIWRDRTLHTVVSPELFDSYLLAALQSESQSLRGLAMNAPSEDGELTSTPSADPEIDQLNSFVPDTEADQDDLDQDDPDFDDEEDEDEDDWSEPEEDENNDDEDDGN